MKFGFTKEDFGITPKDGRNTPLDKQRISIDHACSLANKHLFQMLVDAPVVYSRLGGFHTAEEAIWFPSKGDELRHQARLVCIEAIEKPKDSGEGE